MSDIHCFDVTEVTPLATELARKATDETVKSTDYMSFLPAPKTWIEYAEGGVRIAYLLKEFPDRRGAHVWFVTDIPMQARPPDYYSTHRLHPLALANPHVVLAQKGDDYHGATIEAILGYGEQALLYSWLCIINSPKVFGRRQHMAHRGLQRKLAHKMGGIGKFPLNAWTEILLHVETHDASLEPSTETRLTGQRALHFCRAHLRFRLGHVEFVKSHWRGDAALGIRQSRYTVVP